MSDEFWLDEKNEILKNQYENEKNYYIQEIGKSNICYIFCSSNGIYYPNTLKMFIKTIVEKDRYEWWNVSNSDEILASAGKIIYVRDIYKQYYVKGINGSIDSIEELCKFIKTQTEGMRIITCGTSSGGYLATILGIYLQAECVFNFGGQWSLYEALRIAKEDNQLEKSYYFLHEYRNNEKYKQYYDITTLLKNNKVPIMYFYSALNKEDIMQAQFIREASNVYCFSMKSAEHGYTLFNSCYKEVITCPLQKLILIHTKCKNQIVSLRKMCFFFLHMDEAVKECISDIVRCHKSLQWIIQMLRYCLHLERNSGI